MVMVIDRGSVVIRGGEARAAVYLFTLLSFKAYVLWF